MIFLFISLFFFVNVPPAREAYARSRTQQQEEPARNTLDPDVPLRFEHLSVEQGLSSPFLRSILQDSRGFLWFGTVDGLNRYDGYRFKVYKHDIDDPSSLGANFIRALYEDPSGFLWVGTEGEGSTAWTRRLEQFTRYQNDPADPSSLSDNTVSVIVPGSSGALWIGTAGGLNHFDPQTGKFARPA